MKFMLHFSCNSYWTICSITDGNDCQPNNSSQQRSTRLWLWLLQIRNLAIFSEIRPSPSPANILAEIARCGAWQSSCSCRTFSQLRIKMTQLTCQVVHSQFQLVLLRRENATFIAVPQISSNIGKQWGDEALNCTASTAANRIVNAINFIKNKFSPNPVLAPAEFEFLNPARSGCGGILNNEIRFNPSSQ